MKIKILYLVSILSVIGIEARPALDDFTKRHQEQINRINETISLLLRPFSANLQPGHGIKFSLPTAPNFLSFPQQFQVKITAPERPNSSEDVVQKVDVVVSTTTTTTTTEAVQKPEDNLERKLMNESRVRTTTATTKKTNVQDESSTESAMTTTEQGNETPEVTTMAIDNRFEEESEISPQCIASLCG